MNRLSFYASIILLSMISSISFGADRFLPPIRVGILHSLSGTMASSEQSLVDAIRMAIDEVNQRGGILGRRLESIVEDGESDWPTFARKAEKLIVEDKVASVFGCWTSASRKSVLPVVEEHNHLLWYPVQYEGQESSPNIIYTGAAPNQQIIPAVDWCRREFGTRVFLVGSDYIFPRKANEIIKLRLTGFGAVPVGEEYRPLGSQDFDEIVAKIKASKPDVVLNTINGDSNRAFFEALDAGGIDRRRTPVMSFSIAEDELRHIGVKLTAGHYCSWNYFQSIDTPANRRFVRRNSRRRYRCRPCHRRSPLKRRIFRFTLFAKAVEKANSTDVDAIRQRRSRGLVLRGTLEDWSVSTLATNTRGRYARIGRSSEETDSSRFIWSSDDPIAAAPVPARQPFSPQASATGRRSCSTSITAMIDLEAAVEPANDSQRQAIDDRDGRCPRVILGDARAKFRY